MAAATTLDYLVFTSPLPLSNEDICLNFLRTYILPYECHWGFKLIYFLTLAIHAKFEKPVQNGMPITIRR